MKFNREIYIQGKMVSDHSPVFIIAEAGVNHNGHMPTAKELVDCAVAAKADAVKFQAFQAEHLILPNVAKAPYQRKTTDSRQSQFQMLKSLEMDKKQIRELKAYCDKKR
ncbi:MAG: N-acetylneuraminate synthase family protein, partial [Candidatus Omnitrophota bacterium]